MSTATRPRLGMVSSLCLAKHRDNLGQPSMYSIDPCTHILSRRKRLCPTFFFSGKQCFDKCRSKLSCPHLRIRCSEPATVFLYKAATIQDGMDSPTMHFVLLPFA